MVIAETQSNGKGQYGKKWISNKGNLFVSFFHELKNINISLPSLTKINCLMVKKALQKYYKKKIVFKKPNDLLINKKKISGILQETTFASGNKFLIVGIGVNLIKSPEIKSYPTTNLSKLINKPINKINFENELKVIFEKNLLRMYKINNKVKRN
jgi:BirA family biotin operon repressor/biotin-[acetyl-CoA-carboxylase] ligase